MTAIDHGIEGGLLYGLTAKLAFDAPPEVYWPLFAWGCIEGAWPDAFDWVMWKLGKSIRWYWYTVYHELSTLWNFGPAFNLHVLVVDKLFHDEGGAWWPRLWGLAIVFWLAEAAGLVLMVIR